jgi:PAS domain S-box-containing protein
MQMFDPANYVLTLSVLPPLIVGVLIAALGAVVLLRERGSHVSIAFCLVTTSAAVWLLGSAAVYASVNESLARRWMNVEHVGVAFIPSWITIFTLAIMDRLRKRRGLAWGSLALSVMFYLGIVGTDWFITGVHRYSWGYYPKYGPLSIPFLCFFFGTMFANLRAYRLESRRCGPGARRERLKELRFAFGIGYFGSVDFLAAYGILVHPLGYIPVLGFVALMARAIRRYRLMDITPAFAADHIISTMADALFVLDRAGRIHIVNQAACQLLGKPESELLGAPVATVGRSLFKPELLDMLSRNDFVREHEIALPAGYDGVEALSITASVLRNQAGEPLATVCIVRDITQRKRAEEQLKRSERDLAEAQRQEAMGKFAGVLAHDFNQLLAVITRNSGYLLSGLGKQEQVRDTLEELKLAADQAAKLTQQLLAFNSNQTLKPKPLDLNAIVTGLRGAVQWVLGKEIKLVTVLDMAMGWVKLDPAQIELILMSLAAKARDAMPKGGTLTIKTANVKLDGPVTNLHGTVPAGEYALLEVRDTGKGMDEEALAHLFDPFFTKRGNGKEGGLGLATVYGAIKQSDGSIVVTSKPQQGMSLKVYLPLATS